VEDALLQSFSYISSLYIAAANRIPNGTIEGVLRLFGLERREAGIGTVDVEFTLLTSGGTVEAGTSVYHLIEQNEEIFQIPFTLMQAKSAEPGLNKVLATLESAVPGNIFPIPSGTPLTLAQPSSEILTCVTKALPISGGTAETEEEYLQRGVTYLDSLSQSLCTARQIETYILSSFPEVTRCKVFDLTFNAATMPSDSVITDITINGATSGTDVEIDLTAGDQYFSEFLASRGIDINAQPMWISTPALMGSTSASSSNFPSGLLSATAAVPAIVGFASNKITVTMQPETGSTIENVGNTSVQLLSGLAFTELGVSVTARDEDPRGMFAIFVWGKDGQPVSAIQKQAIKGDIDSKIPIGTTYFIYDVMPVDIYCEMSVEISDGFVGSSVLAEVTTVIDSYFSPENYENWTELLYVNEFIAQAASVSGVKRVVEVSLSNPAYGGAGDDMTPTSNSIYYNNQSMADDSDPSFVQFIYAGTMPKVTSNLSVP
jgi:hypothetical protein